MKQLQDYILKLPGHIDATLADTTVQQLQNKDVAWSENLFYNNINATSEKNAKYCYQSNSVIDNHEDVMQKIWHAIETYVLHTHKSECFSSWKGFTQVEYHRYDPTSMMKKHCDHIHSIFDGVIKGIPILTVLGTLNDGYSGGEFVMFDDEIIQLNKGDVVVFPSCFLYPHTVKELTKGVRYSFVSWVY